MINQIFVELNHVAQVRLTTALASPTIPLAQLFCLGADPSLDRFLKAMQGAARYDVDVAVSRLLMWRQAKVEQAQVSYRGGKPADSNVERQMLLTDFLYSRALIEILSGADGDGTFPLGAARDVALLALLQEMPARGDGTTAGEDRQRVADLFAQSIGCLSKGRFDLIVSVFMQELDRAESSTQLTASLISRMTFVALTLYPLEKLEKSFAFLEHCSARFRQARSDKVKTAWAGLFVELITPIAAIAKSEVNVPIVKKFIESLFLAANENVKKKKNLVTMLPLVTAILSMCPKAIFLKRWPTTLNACLTILKTDKSALQTIAIDCIYRLTWVYAVKFKGSESEEITCSRFDLIIDALFAKGSYQIIPRHASRSILVRLLLFMVNVQLDYVGDVILSLLSLDSGKAVLHPERITLGLRAFLTVTNHLQLENVPPAPTVMSEVMPDGRDTQVKTQLLTALLIDDDAELLGLGLHMEPVRIALAKVMRSLELQMNLAMFQTNPALQDRVAQEAVARENKEMFDLLKICMVAVPRILPLNPSLAHVVEVMCRCTISIDEELCRISKNTLRSLITERPDERSMIVWAYVCFIMFDVPDNELCTVKKCFLVLLRLLHQWRQCLEPYVSDADISESLQYEDNQEDLSDNDGEEKTSGSKEKLPSPSQCHFDDGGGSTIEADGYMQIDPTESAGFPQGGALREMARAILSKGKKKGRRSSREAEKFTAKSHLQFQNEESSLQQLLLAIESVVVSIFPQHTCRKTLIAILRVVGALRDSLGVRRDNEINLSCALESRASDIIQQDIENFVAKVKDNKNKGAASVTASPPVSSMPVSLTDDALPMWGPLLPNDDLNDIDLYSNLSTGALEDLADASSKECWATVVHSLFSDGYVVRKCFNVMYQGWHYLCDRLLVISAVLDIDVRSFSTDTAVRRINRIPRCVGVPMFEGYLSLSCTLVSFNLGVREHTDETMNSVTMLPFRRPTSSPATRRSRTDQIDVPITVSPENFMQFMIPLLREEREDIIEAILSAIRYCSPEVYLALSDELQPLVRAALDLRSEPYKKKRRRDQLRIVVGQVHHVTARAAVGYCANETGTSVHDRLARYLTGTRSYLEMESGTEATALHDLQLSLCAFVNTMCEGLGDICLYERLFTDEVRADLFGLFASWCDPVRPEVSRLDVRCQAVRAIASLCRGVVFDKRASVTGQCYLFEWLQTVLVSNDNDFTESGGRAVRFLLSYNDDPAIFEWAVDLCYSSGSHVRSRIFMALAATLEDDSGQAKNLAEQREKCLALALHMCADYGVSGHAAWELVATLSRTYFGHYNFSAPPSSDVRLLRSRNQLILTRYVAEQCHVELGPGMLKELLKRWARMEPTSTARRQLKFVNCLVPWLEKLNLTRFPDQQNINGDERTNSTEDNYAAFSGFDVTNGPRLSTQAIELLRNLFFISAQFSGVLDAEVSRLWAALGSSEQNVIVIIEYLVTKANFLRLPRFFENARRVVVCVAQVHLNAVVQTLLDCLQATEFSKTPRALVGTDMLSQPSSIAPPNTPPFGMGDVQRRTELFGNPNEALTGPVNSAFLFFEDVISCFASFNWMANVPCLLQASVCYVDAPDRYIRRRSNQIVVNLARATGGISESIGVSISPAWPYEDASPLIWRPKSATDLEIYVNQLVDCFGSHSVDRFKNTWSEKSLEWATNCQVRHYAGRSFQIFYSLQPKLSHEPLQKIFIRLADSIGDPSPEVQGYTVDICLSLLELIQADTCPTSLVYIFWAAVTLLESDHVHEFALVRLFFLTNC